MEINVNSISIIEDNIIEALQNFETLPLREAAIKFLNTLGYYSTRTSNETRDRQLRETLETEVEASGILSDQRAISDWQNFHILFQITGDEANSQRTIFESTEIDLALMDSYVFAVLELSSEDYSRAQLANITRFINKKIEQPIMVIFQYGHVLSLGIINRRWNQRDSSKQVLEQVTLIKDIRLKNPHAAHRRILADLWLEKLAETQGVRDFETLHTAWANVLNTEPLNKKFYSDLYKWYQWAVAECRFPDNNEELQVIRMITRLLFIWFLKEKDLVPDILFKIDGAQTYLSDFEMENSNYYQAVLQNLFFATLNTPINERGFSPTDTTPYRFSHLLESPGAFLNDLKAVPFVNGGLFDCLDMSDGFTDDRDQREGIHVPSKLFFHTNDGIFVIFNRYKFTVEENTPVEQEIALDPELLGQVFENLLGAYNPETQTTARKATGSYYTPRQIVDYMIDESLVSYFLQKVEPYDNDKEFFEARLREDLLAYDQLGERDKLNDHLIDEKEIEPMIDAINKLKIIDPAVGSGAFPMGILNKLVLVLQKLDPQNKRWKHQQIEKAKQILDPESQRRAINGIEEVFSEANRYNDYSRKLYLIQNCIYGVDIQPIATTIAKLRFFISLIVEQVPNGSRGKNYGICPLPNLETKLVAANTLIGLKSLREPELQLLLENNMVESLLYQIQEHRINYFSVNTPKGKQEHIEREETLRSLLEETLTLQCEAWRIQEKNKIAEQVNLLPNERSRQQRFDELQREYRIREAKFNEGVADMTRLVQWKTYALNAVANFFEAGYMFGVQERFDIVIGNPPYSAKISKVDLKQIKVNIQDTQNSNSAALFIDYSKNHLMKPDGTLAFIVPKSLLYSKKWQSLAFILSEKASVLVDVEQAFKNVLLEQIVFVFGTWCKTESYIARKFVGGKFTRTTQISRTYPKTFEAWLCDVSSDEIQLGLKIKQVGLHLCNISKSKSGLALQGHLSESGDFPVVGGRDIDRFYIRDYSGFTHRQLKDLITAKGKFLLQPKIVSQDIVAFIQNPKPHIKITSTIDRVGDLLSLNTITNTALTDKGFQLPFISALFNSTLINWYVHKFIFCSAVRTMHFSNYYIGKIPIPRVTIEDQQPIIRLTERILLAKQENLQADSTEAEQQIDKFVYALYGLTDTEVSIVQRAMGIKCDGPVLG